MDRHLPFVLHKVYAVIPHHFFIINLSKLFHVDDAPITIAIAILVWPNPGAFIIVIVIVIIIIIIAVVDLLATGGFGFTLLLLYLFLLSSGHLCGHLCCNSHSCDCRMCITVILCDTTFTVNSEYQQ